MMILLGHLRTDKGVTSVLRLKTPDWFYECLSLTCSIDSVSVLDNSGAFGVWEGSGQLGDLR